MTNKEDKSKPVISVCLEQEVLSLLDEKSKDVNLPRSWMINFALRSFLGLPNEMIKIGKQKEVT
jgi:metal-responsive CopG/Arc/MetJ family transcriptional regulator